MKQEASSHRQDKRSERRRLGWGTALGFVLAIAGLTLLVMVFLVVVFGSSWLPVYGADLEEPPTLISRLSPALAPAPTSEPIILPTPLPETLFPDTVNAPQSGFSAAALLPQSPAKSGPATEKESAVAEPVDQSTRLEIPALHVKAPIQPVGLLELEEDGQRYVQWQVPNDYVVGWHSTSATLGASGNTVLNGHNNVYGAVFRDLVELELGDEVIVYDAGKSYHYQVAHREVVEEKDQPLDVRLENAKWMFPTADNRLTLISCWPDVGASHRVIVVATAVDGG